MPIDDLVQSVTLYNPRKPIFHGYVLPFLILYAAVVYVWLTVFGYEEHFELGWIALAIVALLQILTLLFCHWFVSFNCLLTANKVSLKYKVC